MSSIVRKQEITGGNCSNIMQYQKQNKTKTKH